MRFLEKIQKRAKEISRLKDKINAVINNKLLDIETMNIIVCDLEKRISLLK